MRKPILLSVLVLILFGSAGAVFAGGNGNRYNIDAPRDQWMSVARIAEKYEARGYDVREVEIDDGVYEISVVDANGMRMEADVHPVTGEILTRDFDD